MKRLIQFPISLITGLIVTLCFVMASIWNGVAGYVQERLTVRTMALTVGVREFLRQRIVTYLMNVLTRRPERYEKSFA